MTWLDTLKFNEDGLIPAIAQDVKTKEILMMAWQNRESLQLTVQTKTAVYFSRSRGKLWHKGESSGHTQIVHDIYTDCDADVVILQVTQVGGISCHTGRQSCFYQRLDMENLAWQVATAVIKDPDEIYGDNAKQTHHSVSLTANLLTSKDILTKLDKILEQRKTADKDSSYVASLYHKGLNKILEKIGEEATETIIAAKELELARTLGKDDNDKKADLVYEVADTWFHSLVALNYLGLSGDDVLAELARRFGMSGIDEKNSRNQ